MNKEPYRTILARWVITANLTLTTASQIGTQGSDSADSTFGRDIKGRVILPGATLAGALRSALEDQFVGYRTQGSQKSGRLFGNLEQHESPLIVFDSIAHPRTVSATIRDGVRIDPKTRLAADGLKYDRELALPDLCFPIRLELAVPQGKNWAQEEELLHDLCLALKSLSEERIRFGARKSRGLGMCRATEWRAKRFPLTNIADWEAYAQTDHENPIDTEPVHETLSAAFGSYYPAQQMVMDKRRLFRLEFDCDLPGTLLIRTPGTRPDDPDMVHLTERGRQLLSGSSVAGALRAHCGRIVRTLGWSATLEDELFGSAPELRVDQLIASRVVVSEAMVYGGTSRRRTRVKIDRFTGGALDTALFDQQTAVRGQVKFCVDCLDPKPRQIGLLLLAARDLIDGLLPLGGEASVGRGVLRGQVIAHFPNNIPSICLEHGVALDPATATLLDHFLTEETT